jgi:hypothetical protein
MTRRLLAFLALLSGLAALSGAATVSYAHATSPCDASVSASADEVAGVEHVRTGKQAEAAASKDQSDSATLRRELPQTLRRPVLMGIDRAYE